MIVMDNEYREGMLVISAQNATLAQQVMRDTGFMSVGYDSCCLHYQTQWRKSSFGDGNIRYTCLLYTSDAADE